MDKKLADIAIAYYHSPIGPIRISATEAFVNEISFREDSETPHAVGQPLNTVQIICIEQLIQYFNGERRSFDFPIFQNGTAFQQQVWNLLVTIPFGKTISYLQLATKTGDPKATRAVANANSRNNIAIMVPCHRVIGAKGELTGYAGGLWRKKWLLEHERKHFYGIQTLFS